MKVFLPRFQKRKSGITFDEYILLAALVWVAIVVGVQVIRGAKSQGDFNIA